VILGCLCSLIFVASPIRSDQDGWIVLHLSGTPHQIGFQHGSQVAKEIDDANKMLRAYLKHNTDKDWDFYRKAATRLFVSKLDKEYRDEIQGLADGLKSKGYHYDFTDMLAHNAWIELAWYYVPKWDAERKKTELVSRAPYNCSAFVATGAMTKDHKIVMAHNAWIDYVIGERWNLVLDIKPKHGNRILMDSWPGFIHSGDDFAVNSAGIMVTETTIGSFKGFDEKGLPEFMRARKAVQYSKSLDDFARIMKQGNNGGYANTWLVGDTKTNEIGELELGLKNVMFATTSDGAFVSSNFPQNKNMIAEECDGDLNSTSNACSDRHTRWDAVMAENKGKIDTVLAKAFLGDHHDQVRNLDKACASTLCGHFDLEDRKGFLGPMGPDCLPIGSVQGKVITSELAHHMSFWARYGHPCGEDFLVQPFLKLHPGFSYLLPYLRDMKAKPWTLVAAK
jgi:hypothetical protein